MHTCPDNWLAFGPAVVHYAQIARAFSAGIKCRHCICNMSKPYKSFHSPSRLDSRSGFINLLGINITLGNNAMYHRSFITYIPLKV